MEAPDKIYLQHNTTTDLYDEFWPEWFEGTHHPERDICYIRKDALIEWAKHQMSFEQGYNTDDAEAAYRFAMKDLIEKLNTI